MNGGDRGVSASSMRRAKDLRNCFTFLIIFKRMWIAGLLFRSILGWESDFESTANVERHWGRRKEPTTLWGTGQVLSTVKVTVSINSKLSSY